MKIFIPTILFSLSVGLLSGCNALSGSNIIATPLPATSPPARLIDVPTPSPSAITPTPIPTAEYPLIAYGDITEGRLDAAHNNETWSFEAEAGERINLVVNSQFDSYIELYAPDGELLASNDDVAASLDAALFDVPVKRSGRHTIVIRGYNDTGGDYALALTGGHPTAGDGLLTSETARTVLLGERGIKWNYEGQKDTYLTIALEAEVSIIPELALFSPDGVLLTRSDEATPASDAEIFEFQLPADGLYTIRAQTANGSGLATLTLNSAATSSGGGPLTMGQTENGMIRPGRIHRWEFTGETGQVINLSMTSTDFDTFLELRDSQDEILAENDDSNGTTDATIDLFALPADGTYSVIARGLSETDAGDYNLTLKPAKVAPGGGSLPPDTATQALLLPDQTDSWLIEAEANSFITIRAQSDAIDTYLELYDSDDQLLAQDDDSGGDLNAAILDFPIKESGPYRVIVRVAQEGSQAGGVYEITLTATESLQITGELASGEPQKERLEEGEQHSWTFQAEENYFVTIKMASPTLDTYLALYNSEGTLLAVNDDFLGNQAVIANYIVPQSGDYRVVARSYSAQGEGDYTIALDITEERLPLRTTPATSPKVN